MPITLTAFDTSPANTQAHIVWKEAYLSAGANQANVGVRAAGTYRGFRLTTSTSNLSVQVMADPVWNDHIANAIDTTGTYALMVRQTGGNFTLNLTSEANTTVYVCLYCAYAVGTETNYEIRAYTTTEFATAPEGPYLVVLGQVVVPATGIIPAANITAAGRTETWTALSPESIPWTPVLINWSWDRSPTASFGSGEGFQVPGWGITTIFSTGSWAIAQAGAGLIPNPDPGPNLLPGSKFLQFNNGTALTSQTATASQAVGVPVVPGQLLRLQVAVNAVQQPTVGTLDLIVNFLDTAGNLTSVTTIPVPSSTFSSTNTWNVFTSTLPVPAGTGTGVATLYEFVIEINGMQFATAGTPAMLFDDAQIWVETNSPLAQNFTKDARGGEIAPGVVVWQDPAAAPISDFSTSTAAAVMRFDSTSGSAPPGGQGQLVLNRRDQSVALPQPILSVAELLLGANFLAGGSSFDNTPRLTAKPDLTAGNLTLMTLYGGSAYSTRVYIDASGGLWITSNAQWNGTNYGTGMGDVPTWIPDAIGTTSWALTFNAYYSGVTQPHGQLWRYSAGGASFSFANVVILDDSSGNTTTDQGLQVTESIGVGEAPPSGPGNVQALGWGEFKAIGVGTSPSSFGTGSAQMEYLGLDVTPPTSAEPGSAQFAGSVGIGEAPLTGVDGYLNVSEEINQGVISIRNESGEGYLTVANGTNVSMYVQGQRSGPDTGTDVILTSSFNSRTNGNIAQVNRGTVPLLGINWAGALVDLTRTASGYTGDPSITGINGGISVYAPATVLGYTTGMINFTVGGSNISAGAALFTVNFNNAWAPTSGIYSISNNTGPTILMGGGASGAAGTYGWNPQYSLNGSNQFDGFFVQTGSELFASTGYNIFYIIIG